MTRRGYTLFEMIVVVALIALLAALAVPPIESMYAESTLQAAVDQVSGKWAAVRARAVIEGRAYRFCIHSNGSDFRAAPDAPEFWSGGDAPTEAEVSGDAPLVVQDSLPRGIRFTMDGDVPGPGVNVAAGAAGASTDSDAGAWSTVAVFLPDGTAQRDGEIRFRSADSGPIALRLRALTGGMSTRWISTTNRGR
jgi:prepilin-type N-terminal cleavage/methylation domain-containing protein